EFILIPTASAIGVFIVFELYVPGGVIEHQSGAIIIFIVTVLSCALAIRKENQKNFREPLMRFNEVLAEFEGEEGQNDSREKKIAALEGIIPCMYARSPTALANDPWNRRPVG